MTEANQSSTSCRIPGERRQSARYEIRGTAWFQWQTVEGRWHEGSGVTRDMGKVGTFVETSSIPPVASQLRVVVTFSMGTKDSVEVRLCGTGDVRHVQRDRQEGIGYGAWVAFRTEAPARAG